MKFSLINISAAVLLLTTNITAQTVYGITKVGSGNNFYLTSIDATSGSMTVISPSVIATSVNNGLSALDPINKKFFFMSAYTGGADTLYSIDLVSGTIVNKNKITIPASHYNQLLEFNPADMTLYAIVEKSTDQTDYLYSVNPATGVETMISTSAITRWAGSGQSTLDPVNGLFFFPGLSDTLYSVSVSTGNLVHKSKLSLWASYAFPVFEFDAQHHTLYTITQEQNNYTTQLASVNPITGSVTPVSPVAFSKYATFASSIDPINKNFFSIGSTTQDTLYKIDLVSGNTISKNKISVSPYYNTPVIEFAKSYSPTGMTNLAELQSSFKVFPNPSNGQLTITQSDKNAESTEITIYNNLGQLVFNQKLHALVETINTCLPKGVYFYFISGEAKQTSRNKLIID
jgi:hypothetical protein